MPLSSDQAVLGYYRAVWELVLRHTARGRVLAASGADDSDLAPTELSTPEALLAWAGHRVGLFLDDPRILLLRVRPGDGADIATAATTALDLAEQVAADGGAPVPLTDGLGGLLVMARITGDVRAAAHRYASGIAGRAPELATLDAAQADGRCVVQTEWWAPTDRRADPIRSPASDRTVQVVPVPYCLVTAPEGPIPVIPLHLDEVAAVAAGMPLELDAGDVPGRVATRGDVASALLGTPTA